jgi:hypothetical protein
MAEPARRHAVPEEAPEYDPRSIERTVLEQRRRREARLARQRTQRNARIRFLFVIVTLLAASIALGILVWHQIQRLFGL